jgi:hypothetical protein
LVVTLNLRNVLSIFHDVTISIEQVLSGNFIVREHHPTIVYAVTSYLMANISQLYTREGVVLGISYIRDE